MGLLAGLHRSPVQVKALFVKTYLELIRDVSTNRKQRTDALRLAMGSSGSWKFESLFPEAFPEGSQQVSPPEPSTTPEVVDSESWSDNARWDYSAVEWKSPSTHKAEYDEIMRKLAAQSRGTMNGQMITTERWPLQGQWR